MACINPTKEMYDQLNSAYGYFNRKLFGNKLPPCLITLQSKGKYLGYAAQDRFGEKDGSFRADEIALNPRYFATRDLKDVMSTLVHEMVHVWQFKFGKPSRGGYHNKEWGMKMDLVGLEPTNTGVPGGKRTGQQMTHYIVPGGAFEKEYNALLAAGKLNALLIQLWDDTKKKSPVSKVKFTCPVCSQNAWGKPSAALICGECYESDPDDIQTMEPEEPPED